MNMMIPAGHLLGISEQQEPETVVLPAGWRCYSAKSRVVPEDFTISIL